MSEKTSDALQKLEQGLQSFLDSDTYQQYLLFLSKFTKSYSLNNTILLFQQCLQRGITPSLFASFTDWINIHHRVVNRNEKGLMIFCPHTYKKRKKDSGDEETALGFHVGYCFNLSQTSPIDGRGEMPEICRRLEGSLADESLLDTLVSIAPVPVSFRPIEGEANGYFKPDTMEIVVDNTNSEIQQAKTLIHECGHVWHKSLTEDFDTCPRNEKEIVAESVAFVVCSSLQVPIDSSEYSFGYLSGYGTADMKEFKANLGLIKKISDQILSDIDAALDAQITDAAAV